MHDDKIEDLLRKAPGLAAPKDLRERLVQDIKLGRVDTSRAGDFDSRPWLQRWLPALSFAVLLFGCLVVIGVQTSTLWELKRQNENLHSAAQNSQGSQANNQPSAAQTQELEQLRNDAEEAQRLREEVAKLRSQLAEADQLRADNQKLAAESIARQAQARQGTNIIDAAIDQAKAQAERIQCVNHLKQLGLAFRIWSNDHNDVMPSDYMTLTKELNNPVLLHCPSDKAHTISTWADVAAGNSSYPIMAPGVSETWPAVVASYCPIHRNYLLVDGSVQQLSPEGEKKLIRMDDGKLMMGR